jgi:REP element-mobilizing transposase RayT
MPSLHVSKDLNSGVYFLTFTVKKWYYIFDRHDRWKIIADSLSYCREHKDLKLYGFVFMLNHIHFIVESDNISGFVCDFKKFTSRELRKNIIKTESTIERLFLETDGTFGVWKDTNMPIFLESEEVFQQKLNYIHENPVRKNYVMNAEDWYWSSANSECEITSDDVNDE